VGTVLVTSFAKKPHPIREEVYQEIKAKATSWYPMELKDNPLANFTEDEIEGLFGTFESSANDYVGAYKPIIIVDTPTDFSSATKWPGKVHPIRD
jgi:hypothetical protein